MAEFYIILHNLLDIVFLFVFEKSRVFFFRIQRNSSISLKRKKKKSGDQIRDAIDRGSMGKDYFSALSRTVS